MTMPEEITTTTASEPSALPDVTDGAAPVPPTAPDAPVEPPSPASAEAPSVAPVLISPLACPHCGDDVRAGVDDAGQVSETADCARCGCTYLLDGTLHTRGPACARGAWWGIFAEGA